MPTHAPTPRDREPSEAVSGVPLEEQDDARESVRILVLGSRQSGKTSFISSFAWGRCRPTPGCAPAATQKKSLCFENKDTPGGKHLVDVQLIERGHFASSASSSSSSSSLSSSAAASASSSSSSPTPEDKDKDEDEKARSESKVPGAISRRSPAKVHGVIILCDVTSEASVEQIGSLKDSIDAEFRGCPGPVPAILVANKVDLLTDIHEGFMMGARLQKLSKIYRFDKWFQCGEDKLKESATSTEFLIRLIVEKRIEDRKNRSRRRRRRTRRRTKTTEKRENNANNNANNNNNNNNNANNDVDDDEDDDENACFSTSLVRGSRFIKYGRRGRPSLRVVWISRDGRRLLWGASKRKPTKCFRLADIKGVIEGQETATFKTKIRREHLAPEHCRRSLSLILGQRKRESIDLIATSDADYLLWVRFFLDQAKSASSTLTSFGSGGGGGGAQRQRQRQSLPLFPVNPHLRRDKERRGSLALAGALAGAAAAVGSRKGRPRRHVRRRSFW